MYRMPYEGFIDYYRVLGLSYPSDTETIKKAYRALARQYHPDAFSASIPSGSVGFQEIQDAYFALSHGDNKEHYDFYYEKYLQGEGTDDSCPSCGGRSCSSPLSISAYPRKQKRVLTWLVLLLLCGLLYRWVLHSPY